MYKNTLMFFLYHYGEDVLKLLDIRPGDTVIDLGCGNGALTMWLAEAEHMP